MPERQEQMGGRFAGEVALVTGAAGGIGLATARLLSAEGCRVMLTDVDAARLKEAAEELAGFEIATELADLSRVNERERLVPKTIERWGRIDMLVNNAAWHGARTAFLDAPEAEWEQVFAVNVTAAATLCRFAARDMRKRRSGAIVNLASIQAEMPVPTYAAYVSSKGAILSLTRALAVELAADGIRVNAVSPGVIATESFHTALAKGGQSPAAVAALLGRSGSPEEVAKAVAFLASSDASFVTGVELYVDGGRRISRRPDPFQIAFGDNSTDGRN